MSNVRTRNGAWVDGNGINPQSAIRNPQFSIRRSAFRIRHSAWGLLFLIAGLLCGCLRAGWEQFDQAAAAQDARRLYAQVGEGRQALLAALASQKARPQVFAAEQGRVRPLAAPQTGQELLGEEKIVFFQMTAADGSTTAALYLSPRDLALRPVNELAAGRGDATITSGGLIRVWRALAPASRLTGRHRTVTCLEFRADARGEIHFERSRQFGADGPLESMPLPLPGGRLVAYLAEENGRHRLMIMDAQGGGRRAMLGEQAYDVLYPRLLPGGELVCAANPEGDYRLYEVVECGMRSRRLTGPSHLECGIKKSGRGEKGEAVGGSGNDLVSEGASGRDARAPRECALAPLEQMPAGEAPERYALATVGEGGRLEASVITLDGNYGLAQLLALTEAHNLAINQKRALLTAALLEADLARLANWPTLDWGLFYTPRVGVLMGKPQMTSGDFLAEGIARGLLGVTQPLLDYRRNSALGEAARWRARIAADSVQNEINERLGEAAELYFEARYLQRLLALDEALLANTDRRIARTQALRERAEATTVQMLAARQVREGIAAEQAFHRDRLEFLKKRIKEVCGLPEAAPLELRPEEFRFEEWEPAPLETLRARALLNHPQMKAAAAALSQAFYLEQSGPETRPEAALGATYGHSRRQFTTPVDDYITLALSGRYPLAGRRARQLHEQQWRATVSGLEIEREAQGRRIANQLEEAVMDFKAARRDLQAKRAAALYYAEALRVARLQKKLGPPNELTRLDPLAAESAEAEALGAEAKILKVEWDLGLRFVRVWRELGLATSLPVEAARWSTAARRKEHPALWVWETDRILAEEAQRDRLLEACRARGIGRLYFYLRSDALLLADPATRERLTQLIELCAARRIEVWGLLGEPEWIEDGDTAAVERAVRRVLDYNAAAAEGQGLRGLKLDLEPHAIKGWDSDAAARRRLSDNFIALVAAAKQGLNGALPLWADVPVKFFSPEQAELWRRLAPLCSGVTLMSYFNQPAAIERAARRVLAQAAGKPVEIGVELSAHAPKTDTLAGLKPEELEAALAGLREALGGQANYAGLALHDARAVMEARNAEGGARRDGKDGKNGIYGTNKSTITSTSASH
jgi:outer membrane protein TolC